MADQEPSRSQKSRGTGREPLTKPKSDATGPAPRLPEKSVDQTHAYLELANESRQTAALDLKQRLTQFVCDVTEMERVSGNVDIPSATAELGYSSAIAPGRSRSACESDARVLQQHSVV